MFFYQGRAIYAIQGNYGSLAGYFYSSIATYGGAIYKNFSIFVNGGMAILINFSGVYGEFYVKGASSYGRGAITVGLFFFSILWGHSQDRLYVSIGFECHYVYGDFGVFHNGRPILRNSTYSRKVPSIGRVGLFTRS